MDETSQPSFFGKIAENTLSKLGITSESVQKIKFGRGVVGKLSVLAAVAMIGVVALGLKLGTPNTLTLLLMFLGGVFVLALVSVIFVVCKQPELSVLEGAELILYKQITLGVKNNPKLSAESVTVPDPQNPVLNPPGGDGDDS